MLKTTCPVGKSVLKVHLRNFCISVDAAYPTAPVTDLLLFFFFKNKVFEFILLRMDLKLLQSLPWGQGNNESVRNKLCAPCPTNVTHTPLNLFVCFLFFLSLDFLIFNFFFSVGAARSQRRKRRESEFFWCWVTLSDTLKRVDVVTWTFAYNYKPNLSSCLYLFLVAFPSTCPGWAGIKNPTAAPWDHW